MRSNTHWQVGEFLEKLSSLYSEYANQKPIRAKSNICSTEGSETNE